jgi:hypothetical protein
MSKTKQVLCPRVEYFGDKDVSIWLEQVNEFDPVIFPHWPPDYPDRVAICASLEGDLAVPLSREDMLAYSGPGRLWFCNVALEELLDNTDAKEAWFQK